MTDRTPPTPFPQSRLRQKAIGAGLARMYAELLTQPAPGQFLDLLEQADRTRPASPDPPRKDRK
jgi:hypothetical protein